MNLQTKLNQQGLRLTRPRQAIMSLLESTAVPLSPQTIRQRTLNNSEDIGLVTIYRTLDLLAGLDLVRRVHGPDGCHGYMASSPGHHHHLVCRVCSKTVEFTGTDDLTAMMDRIQRSTGYIVDEHLLQLYGICPQCQKGKHEKKAS